jgi:hypothetical protein
MGMVELTLIDAKESAKAYQAFVDYVNLGPTRSLRKLVDSTTSHQHIYDNSPFGQTNTTGKTVSSS